MLTWPIPALSTAAYTLAAVFGWAVVYWVSEALAAAQSAGVSPVPPALGAALGASFGFMLPVSTPPNAIVYGSGLVPLPEMVRSGILGVVGAVLIWIALRRHAHFLE